MEMRLWVEAWPSGGYAVRTAESPVPLSRHDTEEEAQERLAAYRRGLARAADDGELVTLRDGSEVLVRPVRPEDKPLFVAGWERFGEESRYERFMGLKQRLTTKELAFFTELDHADHEAIGAIEPRSGEGLGVARYVREPERPDAAEAAVAVIDAWQGRGLGGVLLRRLCARAAEQGITHFTASLFTANTAMLRAFERLGAVRVNQTAAGTMVVDIELPVAGPGMHAALRSAATGHLGPPPPRAGTTSIASR
jgi:RimJ/RimL family protein N-acetyltransferase